MPFGPNWHVSPTKDSLNKERKLMLSSERLKNYRVAKSSWRPEHG